MPDKTSFNQKLRILKFLKKKGGTVFKNTCTVCLKHETSQQCARAMAQAKIDARPDIKLNDKEYKALLEEMMLQQESTGGTKLLVGISGLLSKIIIASLASQAVPMILAESGKEFLYNFVYGKAESVDYTSEEIVELKKDEDVFIQLPSEITIDTDVLFVELEKVPETPREIYDKDYEFGPEQVWNKDYGTKVALTVKTVKPKVQGKEDEFSISATYISATDGVSRENFTVKKKTLVRALKAYSQIKHSNEIIGNFGLKLFFDLFFYEIYSKNKKMKYQSFVTNFAKKYQLGNDWTQHDIKNVT